MRNTMKEYNVTFEITQLADNPLMAAKIVNATLKDQSLDWIFTIQEWEDNKVISVDLLEEDNSQILDVSKEYVPLIIGNNLFTKLQMLDFAFNFYYDLSRKSNVPENLINENFTLVEEYFKETFNK